MQHARLITVSEAHKNNNNHDNNKLTTLSGILVQPYDEEV